MQAGMISTISANEEGVVRSSTVRIEFIDMDVHSRS